MRESEKKDDEKDIYVQKCKKRDTLICKVILEVSFNWNKWHKLKENSRNVSKMYIMCVLFKNYEITLILQSSMEDTEANQNNQY